MTKGHLNAMSFPVNCYHNVTTPGIQNPEWQPFHRHDGIELYLFLGGCINFYVEDSVFSPVRGDLFLISDDQMHRGVSLGAQPYDRFIINLRRDKIDRYRGSETDLTGCFNHSKDVVRRVRLSAEAIEEYCSVASKLSEAVYLRKPADDLLVDAYITEILVLISRELAGSTELDTGNDVPDLVAEVKNYIFSHLTEQITLADLSAKFYFNGKYISAMFKKHTGMTLRSYILEQRIILAKRLLREGSNVSEACYHAGFLDYTNFIRSFTRSVGMSPGKYSRCARAGALCNF